MLYPLNECYFLVHSKDRTELLAEGGKVILDVPTALEIFGSDYTLPTVQKIVSQLRHEWNQRYANKKNVSSN